MSHWILDQLGGQLGEALAKASRLRIDPELFEAPVADDTASIQRAAEALELAILDLTMGNAFTDETVRNDLRRIAADAYKLYRVIPCLGTPIERASIRLKSCSLAVLGDMGSDASRWLCESEWSDLPLQSEDWKERTWSTILDVWLRLIRKQGWTDRDLVLERISSLRESQESFEREYLQGQPLAEAKVSALELIGLYHLAKAGEILAYYMTEGVVDGNYQVVQLLDTHFDRALNVCSNSQLLEVEPLARILAACSRQMAENSIWTVTRAVNSRVTQFVTNLVARGRGNRAIFDVLPPQRRTLAERGLLGSSRRAVVVSLPTSSGKTLIAQFRILQALNQFEHERGWVAYLAPTRVLVNQVARRLRRDFAPLGIQVEHVSPALEIDSIEARMLEESDHTREFRVLVTTPEKLDLMMRQGWESKIGRPLTLVVVDEAHNIQNRERGLSLELLLATINKECQRAQFLLLTPFIENAREVARWLGGQSSDDVSLSLDWQPNDRIIGIVQAERGAPLGGRSFDYKLNMDTVHTTRNTLHIEAPLTLPHNRDIASTFSRVTDQSSLAAVAAQRMKERGPVIVMHTRPSWVWTLADKFKIEANLRPVLTANVELVRQFLSLEFGDSFPLIDLLQYGVGVHHSGLSDEVRALVEWLFEEGELGILAATTTIAQGVNFPVTGVVMASHQYPYGVDMPPEDFWNIAGRAGRVDQGKLGIIALVAEDNQKAEDLHRFVRTQTGELNSALVGLATAASGMLHDLRSIVNTRPEWSTFVQYLAHTYRQMGQPEEFIDQIEQVLRGTFGFEKLRSQNAALANQLLQGIHAYTLYLQEPGQPLSLVDSTGFSLQSIKSVLAASGEEGIRDTVWNADSLFSPGNRDLQSMMGILLRVPELRENLKAVTGGTSSDGRKLALIVKDWVNGVSVPEIATRYFMDAEHPDFVSAMTNCGRNLFGKLTQTASWGLGALLSITGSGLSEQHFQSLRNLPSKVYYGVNDDSAIALRLLGIPRFAATPLARTMGNLQERPLSEVRAALYTMDDSSWRRALGDRQGDVYRKVWRVLEGVD